MSNRLHLVLSYKMRGTLPPKASVPLFAIHVRCSFEPRIKVNCRLYLLVTMSATIGCLGREGKLLYFVLSAYFLSVFVLVSSVKQMTY
jgi:hypothetical protein